MVQMSMPGMALHDASGKGHADVVELLIKHGADVNAKEPNKSTSLHAASGQGHADVTELLIKHVADVNAKTDYESTALHAASAKGHADVAEVLIKLGADVNAKYGNESAALHAASGRGHAHVAELLTKHGADVNAKDGNESLALHAASREGHADVAELLIKHGADVNAKDGTNHPAYGDYDLEKPLTEIKYLDANNLYGWAMSQAMPVGGLHWMTMEELLEYEDGAGLDWGPDARFPPSFLEVDLEYPAELHEEHSDLPLAPHHYECPSRELPPEGVD
ncbi:putative ankyrin repeat protein RF_0381 [Ptychodera flava]|uniref:putative ankyrin repeat protein RF_0381 n=1 Tax=Ptychodera flava TaxID=63121 RepID=UPI003969D42C